ncbi:MAG: hypothetical protein IJI43_02665 [Bacilli bacterium]|nr:hypothetical protein [Bacilli bacterium]
MKHFENNKKALLITLIMLLLILAVIIVYVILSVDSFVGALIEVIIFLSFLAILIGLSIFCYKNLKRITGALKNGSIFKGKIDTTERVSDGRVIVCYANVNGERRKFLSESVDFDLDYVCRELNITEVPVLINLQDQNEYVVDTREILDRVVDLTNVESEKNTNNS